VTVIQLKTAWPSQ